MSGNIHITKEERSQINNLTFFSKSLEKEEQNRRMEVVKIR